MPDFVDCCKMLDELKAASLLQKQTEDTTSASNSSSFFAIMNSAVGLKQSDSQLLPLPRLIKEFERILESYEQDNLYLGEAAMVMVQVTEKRECGRVSPSSMFHLCFSHYFLPFVVIKI